MSASAEAPPAERATALRAAAPPAPTVRTTFERYEYKYWVTEAEAEQIRAFAAPYLSRDAMVKGPVARNVSLYLDTRGLLFYSQHVSGSPDRSKLRVRGYGDPPTGEAFFEIKRKVKSVCLKARARLPMGTVRDVLTGRGGHKCADAERRHLDAFLYLQTVHRAEPVVIIASYRESFGSRFRDDVRLTVDRDMAFQPAHRPELSPDPRAWVPLTGPDGGRRWYGKRRALIELKIRGAAPAWTAELVARFALRREAFSKYTSAIERLRGLA